VPNCARLNAEDKYEKKHHRSRKGRYRVVQECRRRTRIAQVKRDRERAELFTELYERIRDKLHADVSKSAIVKTLAECGLSINIKIFDELLEAEAKRRGEPALGKVADEAVAVESDSAQRAIAYEEGN
jgi:hypothetical protein